jgi:hypothetical protein
MGILPLCALAHRPSRFGERMIRRIDFTLPTLSPRPSDFKQVSS